MRPHTARLNYKNFEKAITDKYGVILIGWPLPGGLSSPGDLSNRVQLETLLHAWESGVTRFEKLTPDELRARKLAGLQLMPASVQPVAPTSTPFTPPLSYQMAGPTMPTLTAPFDASSMPRAPEPTGLSVSVTPASYASGTPAPQLFNGSTPVSFDNFNPGDKRPQVAVFSMVDGLMVEQSTKRRRVTNTDGGPSRAKTNARGKKGKSKGTGSSAAAA